MKDLINIIVLILFAAAAPALFACEYPEKVEVPNGSTASKDDMLTGQREIKQYVADMEAYLDCIVEEEKVARSQMEELSAEDEQARDNMLNKKYNAAVEEMEKVAADFNAEVQTYRARSE